MRIWGAFWKPPNAWAHLQGFWLQWAGWLEHAAGLENHSPELPTSHPREPTHTVHTGQGARGGSATPSHVHWGVEILDLKAKHLSCLSCDFPSFFWGKREFDNFYLGEHGTSSLGLLLSPEIIYGCYTKRREWKMRCSSKSLYLAVNHETSSTLAAL